MSRTRLPSPLRPRLRSRRAASAICSVSSIRRFLIHRLIRCLPSARRIQRLPQQNGMRRNRVCVQPMTRHPPCLSLSLPRGRRAPSRPATACGATLRRFAGRAGGSTHARLQSAAAREDQTEGAFDSGAAPRGTGGPWVYTRAHRCAQPTPAALGTVAVTYQDIIRALPEATHEDIVGVGKQWSGARALEALLTKAGS